ncbi:hypothetical protein [Actinokineospora sp.]|uniref:hypothetical protein n=1 Tax=Actinokineospora sp. TaxID=1872133 RepID=UPI0040380719
MNGQFERIGAEGERLADQIRASVLEAADEAGIKVDAGRTVHGISSAGVAAFAPVHGLQSLTAAELAAGAQIGVVLFAPTSKDAGARSGVYLLRDSVGPDDTEGRSYLLDASGETVTSAPIHVFRKHAAPEGGDVSVTVGDVTITAGPVWVCFDWDDPPGTPGGICHHKCYGWGHH